MCLFGSGSFLYTERAPVVNDYTRSLTTRPDLGSQVRCLGVSASLERPEFLMRDGLGIPRSPVRHDSRHLFIDGGGAERDD